MKGQIERVDQVAPPTVMEQIARGSSQDHSLIRWCLGLAVAAHLLLFAVQWPTFVDASQTAPPKKERVIHVIINYPPTEPPPRQELDIRPPRRQVVCLPDPTPHDPEPIRDESQMRQIEIPFDDAVWAPELEIPAPPGEPVSEPMLVGGEVTAPVRLGGLEPAYPEAARRVRLEGTVILECLVGRDGLVHEVSVLRGAALGMTEAAVKAVRSWTYRPATHKGREVDAIYIVTVSFRLDGPGNRER